MKKKPKLSLKNQILFLIATALLLGSLLVSAISYYCAAHEVDELFDAQLTQVTRVLNTLIEIYHTNSTPTTPMVIKGWLPNIHFEEGHEASLLGHEYERKIAFQVWNSQGFLIISSESAPKKQLADFAPGYQDIMLHDDGWRVFTLKDEKYGYWLQVAERSDIRDELAEEIVFNLIIPILIGIPLICLICAYFINQSFLSLTSLKNHLLKSNLSNFSKIEIQNAHKEVELVIETLNHMLRKNSDSMQREKQFIEDAAHELRTPLSVIKLYTQELKETTLTESQTQTLGKLLKAVERSERMTSQLLTTFRLGLQSETMDFTPLQLEILTRETVEVLAPLALKNHQKLTLHVHGRSAAIQGNSTLVHVMIKNIIYNAIVYAGEHKQVDIEINFDPDKVVLSVIDNGPGLSQTAKSKAFDRFYRGTTGDTKGVGLGLAIVKQIAEILDAKVQLLDTKMGQGLTVTITFKTATALLSA